MAVRRLGANPVLMPLAELLRVRGRGGAPGSTIRGSRSASVQLATQLGLPPSLQFFVDGLQRSLRCLEKYGGQLDECLRMVPGGALDSQALVVGLRALLAWSAGQNWPVDDPRTLPMSRQSGDQRHPLSGYALSVCHHWSNLFYTLDPSGDCTPETDDDQLAYEDLMEEFSMYVLAAQSTIDAGDYLRYCSLWWREGVQPEQRLYPDSRLASRVGDASRAVRRLSRPEHHHVFMRLRRSDDSSSFADRAYSTVGSVWREADQHELDAIYRFLDVVFPGWPVFGIRRRRGARDTHTTTPGRIVRRHYRDGYVRVSESLGILTRTEPDQGVCFESIVPRPQEQDELRSELAGAVDTEALEASELIFPTGDRNRDLEELARAEIDGQQWIPTDERVESGGIGWAVATTASTEYSIVPGIHPGASSRWAADHRRRMLMAHPLVPGRLQLRDVLRVLKAMTDKRIQVESGPALACLHAAIALGRPLEKVTPLEIHDRVPGVIAPDALHFIREERAWVVQAPPPAWADLPVARCERAHWSQLLLRDRTDFCALLEQFGLNHPGRVVGRPSPARSGALEDWVRGVLHTTDAPLAACSGFLFGRLLKVSGGDLGLARLITGRALAHSESVAHYAYYDADVVWRTYQRCWHNGPIVGPIHNQPNHAGHDAAQVTSHGFGARRVPTLAAVTSLLRQLRDRIRLAAPRSARRHNLYTAYTWAGVVLGTGMRPVTDPHLYAVAGGVASQFVATFLDKARSDYHRRVNVIPFPLATHLGRYAQYLRYLDRPSPQRAATNAVAFRYKSPETGLYRAFRPSDFEQICRGDAEDSGPPGFDLELYALRRFMRSELASRAELSGDAARRGDRALSAEDIDAFMGHWFDGLSPHDPLSTYPTMRLQWVAVVVSRLLRDVSFKPLWLHQGRA